MAYTSVGGNPLQFANHCIPDKLHDKKDVGHCHKCMQMIKQKHIYLKYQKRNQSIFKKQNKPAATPSARSPCCLACAAHAALASHQQHLTALLQVRAAIVVAAPAQWQLASKVEVGHCHKCMQTTTAATPSAPSPRSLPCMALHGYRNNTISKILDK
jgi:hypothetical protein